MDADTALPPYWSEFAPEPAPQVPASAGAKAADQWEWEDNNAGSGKWCSYDIACTQALDAAEAAGQTAIKFDIKGEEYVEHCRLSDVLPLHSLIETVPLPLR